MPGNAAIADELKLRGRRLGFDLVGITNSEPSKYRDHFRRWLDEGNAGTMNYLTARFDERMDPAVYFPGVKSVICVAMNYHVPLAPLPEDARPFHARVARYALADDYHELMKGKLHQLADWLRQAVPGTMSRAAVDTAPIMERELAARAGVGWIGKNTCVIHPKVGSWVLLGEVMTTLELPPDEPMPDHCGTCRRCIDACPTHAITQPYQLDARRCISYLTIEHRGEVASDLGRELGDWLYGCDICQDVCPHNHDAAVTKLPALQPRHPTGTLDLRTVMNWKQGEPNDARRNSAMKRVKLPVLQENAKRIANERGVLIQSSTPRDVP